MIETRMRRITRNKKNRPVKTRVIRRFRVPITPNKKIKSAKIRVIRLIRVPITPYYA